jgi:hypothetical protein
LTFALWPSCPYHRRRRRRIEFRATSGSGTKRGGPPRVIRPDERPLGGLRPIAPMGTTPRGGIRDRWRLAGTPHVARDTDRPGSGGPRRAGVRLDAARLSPSRAGKGSRNSRGWAMAARRCCDAQLRVTAFLAAVPSPKIGRGQRRPRVAKPDAGEGLATHAPPRGSGSWAVNEFRTGPFRLLLRPFHRKPERRRPPGPFLRHNAP